MSKPWETDGDYERHQVSSCRVDNDGLDIAMDGCGVFWVTDELPPKKDQWVRLYGKGFGFSVRGIAVEEDDGSLRVLSYRSEEEEKEYHKASVAKKKQEDEQAWEDGLADFTEAVAALPEPFQIRFRWFMRDPAWGASSGRYELFCCQEAAKIAAYLDHDGFIDDHMTAFYSSEEDQDAAGVADGHSGNTFGMSCRLAAIYLTDPEILWMAHGALCGMVGCETAGCYAGASGTEALSEMGE